MEENFTLVSLPILPDAKRERLGRAAVAGRQVSAAPAELQSYQIWAVEPGAVVSQGGAEL